MDLSRSLPRSDHNAALDGLRGFAAISVVLVHLGSWLNFPALAHNSGLALDLFFCLSGFVLPLAYEKRFRTNWPLLQFVRVRLIRLMPLIVLGTLLSAPYVLARSHVVNDPISYQELLLAIILGVTNIPFLSASTAIGGPQVFPLNGPQFSLFLEVFVNVLWAGVRTYNPLRLYILTFAVCLITLSFVGRGGYDVATFWTGFPRVGASFFAGAIVFHIGKKFDSRAEPRYLFWLILILTALLFYYPEELPLSIQLVWVALFSPLLVYAGSKTRLSGKVRSLALFSGELSYPIYALHYPIFCWMNGAYQSLTKQPQTILIEGPIVLSGVLLGSYLALRSFDIPIRNWAERSMQGGAGRWVSN
jgi:peptidoglycan/LPS O-acetylase OafA/YrhL